MQQQNTVKQNNRGVYRADPSFKHKLEAYAGGSTLKYCYQCGTCTSVCPISKFIPIYKPNKIIEHGKLGIRNLPQSNAFLFCSACTLCTKGCPQNVRVHEVMQALKDIAPGDTQAAEFLEKGFDETIEALGREIPLPLVYSWICLRPSESGGGETGADGATDGAAGAWNSAVKKAFERALKRPYPLEVKENKSAAKVAVIGSGPAGLTAAFDLAKSGFLVTVFESLPQAGGMLRTGIPDYRLPKEYLDDEIDRLKAIGVVIKTNAPVDVGFFDQLIGWQGEYKAVFIATGSYSSRKLSLDGEKLSGVIPAIEFLKEYNLNGCANISGKVVVIGGGNVATDAAGAAVRCGAESVRLFCLESRKKMPAHEWEIEEAAACGVEINPSWGPATIFGDKHKVTGVQFKRCESVVDANGRFNPVFNDKERLDADADAVIYAIGQGPDLSFLSRSVATARGSIQTDPYTMETSLPGVFAAGDAVSGTASLIEAITGGKAAARSIKEYLQAYETI